jgi:hypothetical protein
MKNDKNRNAFRTAAFRLPVAGLSVVGLLIAGLVPSCALRDQPPFANEMGPGLSESRVPPAYNRALAGLVQSGQGDAARLQQVRRALEDEVGARKSDRLIGNDAAFANEEALCLARRGEFEPARHLVEKGLAALDKGVRLKGSEPFAVGPLRLDGRLYDEAAMHVGRDLAIMRAFRDFYVLRQQPEREFVDRVMRRTHRFPPQPSLFPGSLATIPLEIVNDWHYRSRQSDLLTWRRFSHVPSDYSERQIRSQIRSLAMNLLVLGALEGRGETVTAALDRLVSLGPPVDQESQSVMMFGYFILGDAEQVARYQDPVLKSLLTP